MKKMFEKRKHYHGIIRIEPHGICARLWKKGSEFPNTAEWATVDIPKSKRSYEEMARLMDEIAKTINSHLRGQNKGENQMSEEELGEVKIVVTTGAPKLIITTYKDGRYLEVPIEKIKWSHSEEKDEIIIKKMIIRSLTSKAKKDE